MVAKQLHVYYNVQSLSSDLWVSALLWAKCFIVKGNEVVKTYKLSNFVKDCSWKQLIVLASSMFITLSECQVQPARPQRRIFT